MKRLFILLAGLISLSCAALAQAEGYALYEYSARGNALGGAMVGRADDASALAYNPAGITQLQGSHFMGGMSVVTLEAVLDTDVKGNTDSSGNKKSPWVVPHLYYTQEISPDWYFGVGIFSRFGLGSIYANDNWPGRYSIYHASLETVSVNPNIAWKATDKLSLAFGVEVMRLDLDLRKKVDPTGSNNPYRPTLGMAPDIDSRVTADSYGFGVNAAAHYKFNEQWAAGVSYRSQMQHRATGDVEFDVPDRTAAAIKAGGGKVPVDSGAHGTVVLPDSVAFGVAYKPLDNWSVEVGGTWTRWSTFDDLPIHMESPNSFVSNTPKDWRDTWRWGVGVEYLPTDWLALRAGYVYDESPMTKEYEDYLVPSNGRQLVSGGLGFKWDNYTADLSYTYIFINGRNFEGNPSIGVWPTKTRDASAQIVGCSLGYSF